MYRIGIDVGSTTVKLVVLDNKNEIIYSKYQRHFSDIRISIVDLVKNAYEALGNIDCSIVVTGSGGLSVSKWLNLDFIQEVIACSKTVEVMIPETDVVIELGGEDAKITYFNGGLEQRMNGSCAGGTGAFIDQMAVLLNTDAQGLNEYAKSFKVIYPIASRCGVFAKTDIQPLINQGAHKEDIAASIFQAVVNQTISGLACGKPIRGNVAFLGGPLNFLSELRNRFVETLRLTKDQTITPKNAELFVAIGAALLSDENKQVSLKDLVESFKGILAIKESDVKRLTPLFRDEEEYRVFKERHNKAIVKRGDLLSYKGKAYLGIDAGSTTTKVALINDKNELIYSFYEGNDGDPLKKVIKILNDMYKIIPKDVEIVNSTVTGYGEDLIKQLYI